MTPWVSHLAIWTIAAIATAGVIVRPFRLPEAVWAVGAGVVLLAAGLLPLGAWIEAIGQGGDVYLFLAGMMLLSETARREGLFDWVAARAVNLARGSPARLFSLIYAVGVVVTAFLSNDATAVVLTPAVFAASRKAKAEPAANLFACAMVANAASFVLPISNPANLVLYGDHTPPLGVWLASFALPSTVSVIITYGALRWAMRDHLDGAFAARIETAALAAGGRMALAGIAAAAIILPIVSALGLRLGLPTCIVAAVTAGLVSWRDRASPWPLIRGVSWSILPLVAGLFVIVEALRRTGLIAVLAHTLTVAVSASPNGAAFGAGSLLALATNLTNNLPAGLVASATLAQAHPPGRVIDALLIGIDLGPNLSITGSLATILWLTAIRREGGDIGFWRFLRVGAMVMTPALALTLAVRLLLR